MILIFGGELGRVASRLNWFDTLTGRVGYAFTPGWLIYGQGGVAWANTSTDVTLDGFDFGSFGRTRSGWTAGGGVEWMFARHWSAFLEGNYMDSARNNHTIFDPVNCLYVWLCLQHQAKATTILVGLNYRFGGLARRLTRQTPVPSLAQAMTD